ncbi:MAG: tyrosine-type recombinase/integrase [Gemmatimonadota bacterium]
MARTRKKARIYWRERGGVRRAYGDFRDFADVGGKREALIPRGMTVATDDPAVAEKLVDERLEELQGRRRYRGLYGTTPATLEEFAAHHLDEKAKAGVVTDRWLVAAERQLRSAIEFFGADRDLSTISVSDVQAYAGDLVERPNRRGGTLSASTRRHYLNTLSNLYRRAQSEEKVPSGFNPVASLLEKPTAARQEAKWLEVADAALLLEAARTFVPPNEHERLPIYPLIATFLLTGGRRLEVLGLEAGDVSFDRKTVTFRPNRWRRLKTRTSHRVVPLWPQLEQILREYVDPLGRDEPLGELLFPSPKLSGELMITDTRKALDAIAKRAQELWMERERERVGDEAEPNPAFEPGHIRTRIFRHTYCTARPSPRSRWRRKWVTAGRPWSSGSTPTSGRSDTERRPSSIRSRRPRLRTTQRR